MLVTHKEYECLDEDKNIWIQRGVELGDGTFGKVYKGKYNQQDIAIKEFKSKNKKAMMKEFDFGSKFDHPNIIKFYEFLETKEKCYIVMEYAENGSLKKFIQDRQESGGLS